MSSLDYESFCHPEDVYRGTDFWMLNDALEEDELVRQMREMRERGIVSFIARTYVGLKSDYPGEDFLSKMRVIVGTARELGMKLFLQAVYMPDKVVGMPREYSLRQLTVSRGSADAVTGVLYSDSDIIVSECRADEYLDIFNADSVDYYLDVAYNGVWREFACEFGRTIASIWVDEPSFPGDKLPYPVGIEKLFSERYGYSLTDNLASLFLDRPGYMTVRYHYRMLLLSMMEENYFRRMSSWCSRHGLMTSGHLLFEETMKSQLMRACAVMPFYKYFDIPGVDVLSSQQNWRRRALRPISGDYRYREVMMTTPIQCASAARQAGKSHVLCEMYGVVSEDMGFREQKHMFDYLAAHGIDHRSIHGVFYSLGGRAKRLYPPHVNYYQPYWDELGLMTDYVASVSRYVTLGEHEGTALVIHPMDSAACEFTCPSAATVTGVQSSSAALDRRDKQFIGLLSTLTLSGCPFDLGDEGCIADMGSTANGLFTVGKVSYDTVVLPSLLTVRSTTLELLERFSRAGGRVIVLGTSPKLIDGAEASAEPLDRVCISAFVGSAAELVPYLLPRGYSVDEPDGGINVITQRRVSSKRAYYYLFNTDCSERHRVTLTVDGAVSAESWCPFTHDKKSLPTYGRDGKTVIELILPEGGNALVVTDAKEACAMERAAGAPKKRTLTPVSERFTPTRSAPNVLLLDFCSFKRAGGEYGDEYPILAVKDILTREGYRGEVTLRFTFTAGRRMEGLSFALEQAREWRIRFNGEPIASEVVGWYVARSFETVRLPCTQSGENVIEITRDFLPLEPSVGEAALFETRVGTDIEPVYVVGDFAVMMHREPERNGTLRYSRRGITLESESETVSGELTHLGYPFYSGTIELCTELEYHGPTDGARIVLGHLDACVCRVILNGRDVGALCTHPYELDVSDALREGKNTLILRISNTLRNLIGPHHRTSGELGYVRGSYEDADIGWMGGRDADDSEWYLDRSTDTGYWSDSYRQVPFGVGEVYIARDGE